MPKLGCSLEYLGKSFKILMLKPHVRANKFARNGSQTSKFVKALLCGSSVWLTLGSTTVQRKMRERQLQECVKHKNITDKWKHLTNMPVISMRGNRTLLSPFSGKELRFISDKKCVQNPTDGARIRARVGPQGFLAPLTYSANISWVLATCQECQGSNAHFPRLFQARARRGWHRAPKPVLCPLPGSQTTSLLHLLQAFSHLKFQLLPETFSNVILPHHQPGHPNKLSQSQGLLQLGPPWTVQMNENWRTCHLHVIPHTHTSNTPSQVDSTIHSLLTSQGFVRYPRDKLGCMIMERWIQNKVRQTSK